MSLSKKSELSDNNGDGGISNAENSNIILNIYGNNQSNKEDKSSELIETEANLKLSDINNNTITQQSVETPNNILLNDNTRDNHNPLSDNFKNQIYSNEKIYKPINNINSNLINEVEIHQNNNIIQQNNNIIQQI